MKTNKNKEEQVLLIEKKMEEVLILLGLDLNEGSLKEAPRRIAHMYVYELFSGLDPSTFPNIHLYKEKGSSEQVVSIKKIQITSFCEHHFLPMMGFAHIAYRPANDYIIGLSQVHQLVRYCAQRPQLQERLTLHIAEQLIKVLQTEDVAVFLSLRHCCVTARGVEDRKSKTETLIVRGAFKGLSHQQLFN